MNMKLDGLAFTGTLGAALLIALGQPSHVARAPELALQTAAPAAEEPAEATIAAAPSKGAETPSAPMIEDVAEKKNDSAAPTAAVERGGDAVVVAPAPAAGEGPAMTEIASSAPASPGSEGDDIADAEIEPAMETALAEAKAEVEESGVAAQSAETAATGAATESESTPDGLGRAAGDWAANAARLPFLAAAAAFSAAGAQSALCLFQTAQGDRDWLDAPLSSSGNAG